MKAALTTFLVASLIWLTGCGAQRKPAKQRVPAPPPGYVKSGNCIGDSINAKTGLPDILICKTNNGEVSTYKRQ